MILLKDPLHVAKMGRSVKYQEMLLLVVLMSGVGLCVAKELTIAAFNVQIFGQKKSDNAFIMDVLVRIIMRYDIILIQEIRDSKGTAIVELLDKVNAATPSNQFEMRISERLGRSHSKEQYAFLYRQKSGLRVERVYTYEDSHEPRNNQDGAKKTDTFEREPYVLLFSSKTTVLKEFALAGVHIAPEDAVDEIKALKEVFIDIQRKMGTTDIMIMGDLNADCSYVPRYKWKEIALKADPSYYWLIDDGVDTTVSKTDCAYDRFIGKGSGFKDNGGVVPGSAKVFNYMEEYKLSLDQALLISDHFPIEFKLKDKGAVSSPNKSGRTFSQPNNQVHVRTNIGSLTPVEDHSYDQRDVLRTVRILNVYVNVPGRSLSMNLNYFINDISLNVETSDGVVVGSLIAVSKKDKDIRMAVGAVLSKKLYKDEIRVQMVRTRKYRGKQLATIIIKFDNLAYQRVENIFQQTLKGYGNVLFI